MTIGDRYLDELIMSMYVIPDIKDRWNRFVSSLPSDTPAINNASSFLNYCYESLNLKDFKYPDFFRYVKMHCHRRDVCNLFHWNTGMETLAQIGLELDENTSVNSDGNSSSNSSVGDITQSTAAIVNFPTDVLLVIISYLDDLLSLNDLLSSCKSFHENSFLRQHAKNMAFEYVKRFLVRLVSHFDPKTLQFCGTWKLQNISRIMSLTCKTLLALPCKIDNDRWEMVKSSYKLPILQRDASDYFRRKAGLFFRHMLINHQFDNTDQCVRFCKQLPTCIMYSFIENVVPNIHFSKMDSLYFLLTLLPNICDFTDSTITLIELVMEVHKDDLEVIKELLYKIMGCSHIANASCLLRLAVEPGMESLFTEMSESNQSSTDFILENACYIRKSFHSATLEKFVTVAVMAISHGKSFYQETSASFYKLIVRHLCTTKYETNVIQAVLEAIVKNGFSVASIELQMMEFACVQAQSNQNDFDWPLVRSERDRHP